MEKFKKRWDIQHNWQLIFPFLGLIGLLYSGFKLAKLFTTNTLLIVLLTIIISITLLKVTLFLFKKLETKWKVTYKWEMIRIFIVFAVTGSSSLFVGRPLINWLGITKENLNVTLYWILYSIIGLIFYQILLVFFGWLAGQHKFFWEFEKKMLRRFGLGKLVD
ncbi:DUF6787 family protein [Olleya aquimaris]|uniref:DUF6787 domain-containing protein n=1 Tax=Olleya aquimaris TaxID=639310 RepID=A0A327R5W9_9FLAO|nr:DUF6787 family protein [Olleya aquimaris]RAJ12011.1 hypothetical protein LY08_02511 [Olleya aquimaris]